MLDVDQFEAKKIKDMEADYPDILPGMAAEAIVVQGACNLTGVVHAMATAATRISAQAFNLEKSTEWKNRHPVMLLFAEKIADLAGVTRLRRYDTCLTVCQRAAERKD